MADELAEDDVAASIAELQNLLLDTQSAEDFLQELAILAAGRVTGGLPCGITLQPNGRPLTVASSDTLAERMDEVQYDIDNGPCLHVMRTGQQVRIEDTTGEERWAGFSMRAAGQGIRSTLSLPLTADGQHIGALNLYAPLPAAFGPAETRRAETLAANATGALTLAVRQAASTALTSQLRRSLAARAVIDQALGSSWPSKDAPRPRHSRPCGPPRRAATSNSATSPPRSSPASLATRPSHPLRRNLTGNRLTAAVLWRIDPG